MYAEEKRKPVTDLPLDTELASVDAPGPSDAELITAVRSGDTSAFGPLFDRHVGAARALARQMTRDAANDSAFDASLGLRGGGSKGQAKNGGAQNQGLHRGPPE